MTKDQEILLELYRATVLGESSAVVSATVQAICYKHRVHLGELERSSKSPGLVYKTPKLVSDKWAWKMEWCRINGLAPANAWERAGEALKEHLEK